MEVSAGITPKIRRGNRRRKNIILIMTMEEKLNPIEIKTSASRTVTGSLETRVGREKVHLGTSTTIRYRVHWQEKKIMVQLVMLPMGGKCEYWVIVLDVMLPSGYVRRYLLNKEIFHL